MPYRILLIILVTCFSYTETKAQLLNPDTSFSIIINGNHIENAWVGGFDSPQFSEIDLNQDSIMDLFVFDKAGGRISTFINEGITGQISYRHAPNYKDLFPVLSNWVLLIDYNCDGRNDIFTGSEFLSGIRVYNNISTPGTGLKFELEMSIVNTLSFGGSTNLYVGEKNIPALIDVDGDSDLDILTFTFLGDKVELHKNLAIQNTGSCDTLLFERQIGCWGNFSLLPNNSAQLGVSCRLSPLVINQSASYQNSNHGTCLLGLDIDGDSDIDIINGLLPENNLLLLVNGGSNQNSTITSQDSLFPNYDIPVDLSFFPGAYFMDVNNDGAKDLLVTPCTELFSENFNNVLFYKNINTTQSPVFQFENDRFLSDQMIEVGSGANVELFDVDQDGLLDMLIGNYGYYDTIFPFKAGISYYRNSGTQYQPVFELITRDFANLDTLDYIAVHPCFGDLDGDGDDDMLIGDNAGNLHYFTNTAGAGNPVNFVLTEPNYQNIHPGNTLAPFLFDLNADGKLDLIVGKRNGFLSYYENVGFVTIPFFSLVTHTLGGVDVNRWWEIGGSSNPVFFNNGGNIELLVGSNRGKIYHFGNISNNLNGTFNVLDSSFSDIDEVARATVSMADIDNDGIQDLLVGNYAGGVIFYTSTSTIGINLPVNNNNIFIYPNPSDNIVNIELYSNNRLTANILTIYNITGQVTHEETFNSMQTQVNTSNWVPGVYIVKIETHNKAYAIQKLIIK